MSRATYPHIYRAISRITAEFAKAGIPKLRTNLQDQYQYRSIDDVTVRLAPLLARHGLCVLPRVLRRQSEDWTGPDGEALVSVRLLVRYDLVSSRDGSAHSIQVWGEALDHGDKGTAKAMSSAFKYAMLQLFCIPVEGEDADSGSHRISQKVSHPEPPQGWTAWGQDMITLVDSCESAQALDRLRTRHGAELAALKRSHADLYAKVGDRFSARSAALAGSPSKALGKDRAARETEDA